MKKKRKKTVHDLTPVKCPVCEKECLGLVGLAAHLGKGHKFPSKKVKKILKLARLSRFGRKNASVVKEKVIDVQEGEDTLIEVPVLFRIYVKGIKLDIVPRNE
jgi:hypothetical protein